jgi:hypothetical protein
MQINIDILSTPAEYRALAPAWNALVGDAPRRRNVPTASGRHHSVRRLETAHTQYFHKIIKNIAHSPDHNFDLARHFIRLKFIFICTFLDDWEAKMNYKFAPESTPQKSRSKIENKNDLRSSVPQIRF